MSTQSSNVTSTWTESSKRMVIPEGCVVLRVNTSAFIPWNNPDNIISQDIEQAVDEAVSAVCLPILFLISAPSNILNMLVFWKQGLKERINLCLFCLSLVDFLHMFHTFLCNVDQFYVSFNQVVKFGPVLRFIVDHRLLGFRSLTWLSGFVSTLIACERCFCVVSPLRSQTILKTRTTAFVLAFATVVILTGGFVASVRWDITCVFDPVTNRTSESFLTSQFYANNRPYLNVLFLFYATVQPLIYVTVIMVTTIVTSLKLKAMVAWREQTSSKTLSSSEIMLTRMLIATSVLYIVCSFPSTVSGTSALFIPDIGLNGRYYNFANLLRNLFELASFINASFNFLVYVSLGSKYRNTLKTLFCRFPCRSARPDSNE